MYAVNLWRFGPTKEKLWPDYAPFSSGAFFSLKNIVNGKSTQDNYWLIAWHITKKSE